ncbi:DMT family transporter [Tanticharoenia sakaeratensis]|nr:DMT family transporter [Tanticharoenia sakaeratensis]
MSESMRPPQAGQARRGDLLMGLSALGFSTAGLFARLSGTAIWPMIVWRDVFGIAGLLAVAVVLREPILPGLRLTIASPRGRLIVLTNALATLAYIAAFAQTAVADVSVIYAASPPIAAICAWIMFREKPGRRTMACMAVCLGGVAITVAGSLGHGRLPGDALALLMTVLFTIAALQMRTTDAPPIAVALLSSALAGVLAAGLAVASGISLRVTPTAAGWLACFGTMSLAIAYPAYLAAVRLIPAGRAMLISTMDLPLAPLWVWLACGEAPSGAALIGGAIILAGIGMETAPVPAPSRRPSGELQNTRS